MSVETTVTLCAILKQGKEVKVMFSKEHKWLLADECGKNSPRKAASELLYKSFGLDTQYVVLVEEGFKYIEYNPVYESPSINLLYSYIFYEPIPCKRDGYEWVPLDEIIKLRPLYDGQWEIIQRCLNAMGGQDNGYDAFYEALENSPGVA